ncbi:MAG: RHS repeat-associated core domain-containing protein, partial [Deltaproteobacteria bacterium]|nr:RHS repeat-associated core domain-containing protein [Deltaproteobacteria bacterium]
DTLSDVTTYTYGGTGAGCASCSNSGGDNLTSITDAKGHTTTYQYDTKGRLTKETDYLGNVIAYTYDAKGNLVSKRDANGSTIQYAYDQLNRLTKKTYPDTTQETYMYNLQGSLSYVSNQYISYTFSYDAKGRLLTVKDGGGQATSIAYEYDKMGNKISMSMDGNKINYAYDSNNRLTSITDPVVRSFSFAYDKAGRRLNLAFPNGVTTKYSYDTSGRLTNLLTQNSQLQTLNSYTYTMDKVGNRLTKTEPDVRYSYSYDNIYRLTQALPTRLTYKQRGEEKEKDHEQDNKSESFGYDEVGNRLRGPETKDFYSYNQINQLTEDRKNSYEYDKNGNLIKKTEKDNDGKTETTTYSYDYENRLIKVTKQESSETKTVSFIYDPFGRRIRKTVEEKEEGKTETKIYDYVYDNEDIILEYLTKAEDGQSKTEKTRYIHGPGIDEPLAIERKGEVYYYHADGLGSITALTDKKQKVVESYTYDSFGKMKRKGDKVKNTFTYTGREWDEEIGAYNYRWRTYDQKIGRFTTKDPIGFGGGINFYVYAKDNPTNYTDPYGLRSNKGWLPPDLNPPGLPPTPDSPDDDPFPFTPPPRSKSAACAVCKPVFHPNVYWSCVYTYAVSQPYLEGYLAGFGFLATPSGATTAIGAAGILGISNYIGYTCRQKATYCD